MKKITWMLLVVFMTTGAAMSGGAQIKWPGRAKAAVVLTYDDGLDCHLDVVVPQLDEFGFKGTFFCTGKSQSLDKRMDEWRQIARNGHELGNHTLFHPCNGKGRDWVKPEYDLSTYTREQLEIELQTANTLLKALDGSPTRTFAYTCSDYQAGGLDVAGTVQALFPAARGSGPLPDTMEGYDLNRAPSWMVENKKAGELIAYVEEARSKGTIAIFMFHSVGGGYLNVDAAAHQQLLEYLDAHRDQYYVATFGEAMNYIRQNRQAADPNP